MVLGESDAKSHRRCLGFPRLVRRNKVYVGTILCELNVPCKLQRPFFLANEAQLEYIYCDFEKASRRALADAHPDSEGGDTEQFQNLLAKVQMVHRSFGRFGIGRATQRTILPPRDFEREHIQRLQYNRRWRVALGIYTMLRYHMRKDGALP